MANKVEVIATPFRNDDEDPIRMCIHGCVIWFETEYETMQEFDANLLSWAAKKIEEKKQ